MGHRQRGQMLVTMIPKTPNPFFQRVKTLSEQESLKFCYNPTKFKTLTLNTDSKRILIILIMKCILKASSTRASLFPSFFVFLFFCFFVFLFALLIYQFSKRKKT